MNTFLLAFALTLNPDIGLLQAKHHVIEKDYEAADYILRRIHPGTTHSWQSYFFYKAVTDFSLLRAKDAEASCDILLNEFDNSIPTRYIALAHVMKEDIKTWEKKDLGDLSRRMKEVTDRLTVGKAGPETRKKQAALLQDLDKMIAQAEKAKEDSQSKADSAGKGQDKDSEKNAAQGPNPLDDSKIGGVIGKGEVDTKKLAKLTEVWGKLPEKERAMAMVELTRGLPPRYKEAIRTYFINIANKEPKGSK